ncbi:hypothetical protein, partial [Burkholderia multivorans]|uniref:hypothetical protein n=1 Tax=Burkholderia multivorans TaxID=87883 RepID=UPI0035106DB8
GVINLTVSACPELQGQLHPVRSTVPKTVSDCQRHASAVGSCVPVHADGAFNRLPLFVVQLSLRLE